MRSPFLSAVLFVSIACAGHGVAQSLLISPVNAASVDGSSRNSLPFGDMALRRYQQIHSDLGPSTRSIERLAFRMDQGTNLFDERRRIELEMWMGDAPDHAAISTVYAANHLGTPSLVIARKAFVFGPQGRAVWGPNPFLAMDLPLDAPHVHLGTHSLIWDIAIHQHTRLSGSGFSALDADRGSTTLAIANAAGTGCVATGQTQTMLALPQIHDVQGVLGFAAGVMRAPAQAPCLLAIGVSNPGLVVPGLCSPLHTDLLLTTPMGTSDAGGSISPLYGFGFHVPNVFLPIAIFTQVHALDPQRGDPIPICNSDGAWFTVPSSDLTRVVRVSRMTDNSNSVMSPVGFRSTDSTVGFGLVVQFAYH